MVYMYSYFGFEMVHVLRVFSVVQLVFMHQSWIYVTANLTLVVA
jgi:hypothetical protein